MLSNFNYFIFGILTGIYVSQNYHVPNISRYIDMSINYVRKIEVENRK